MTYYLDLCNKEKVNLVKFVKTTFTVSIVALLCYPIYVVHPHHSSKKCS